MQRSIVRTTNVYFPAPAVAHNHGMSFKLAAQWALGLLPVALLHMLTPICLRLVAQFIIAPMQRLREYIRPRSAAGELLSIAAEPGAHMPGIMLGLFAVPGIPWAFALVMHGTPDRVVHVVASAVVRWDVAQIEHGRRLAERDRVSVGMSKLARLTRMAFTVGAQA